MQMRKGIFEKTLQKVKKLNRETYGASFSLNFFSDMTDYEMD